METVRDFMRQGRPEIAAILGAEVLEERCIRLRGVFPVPENVAVETEIVRMRVEQDHAAVFGHPIELFPPEGVGALAEYEEESGVLGESVGKLDVTGVDG